MMSKRKNTGRNEEITARDKKKLKVTAARSISVQSTATGSTPQNAVAGPSSGSVSGNAMPSTIDVEKFVEARAYEIEAMHAAMRSAPASATHRVWQTLPRHLRRRAASHNVKRVPLRLRDKAKAEMDPIKNKSLKVSQLGKEKRIPRTEAFAKRQADKSWLETHIWHAKRMHMGNIWGYRLAISPTEKAYRPSHRAAVHGSILHDASYYSLLELKGPEAILINLLESCCDPQSPSPRSKRYLTGSRACETHIYKSGQYPFGLIAPIIVIWRPTAHPNSGNQTMSQNQTGVTPTQGGPQPSPASSTNRIVWLRFHPSVYTPVLDILKEAASLTLARQAQATHTSQVSTLDIVDLKGHMNVFEIIGPKSSQVVKGALTPIPSDKRDNFRKFWSSLTDTQSSGSYPGSLIVGFKVDDPRLRFPPKNVTPDAGKVLATAPTIILPSPTLASSEIWEPNVRIKLAKPRFQKKDIDLRRAKNDIPGTKLTPSRQDDRIPVILIQNSVESVDSTESLHGWTLIIPAGWGMTFMNSLVHTGTRVGGQLERQTQAYNAGMAYFPRDYPSTEAYEILASTYEESERQAWNRKPPAKRVNFELLGTSNPWRADWNTVLGIFPDPDSRLDSNFVSTQRETSNQDHPPIKPWLLRGPELPKILSNLSSVFNHAFALYSEINKLRLKRNLMPLDGVTSEELLQGALVPVKVNMCSRGSPDDLAMIYMVPDDLVKKWNRFLQTLKKGKVVVNGDDEIPEELELASIPLPETSIIGYVTTGHYSLSQGKGFGIGAISLKRTLELEQQGSRLHPNQQHSQAIAPLFALVRNPNSELYRSVKLEVLAEMQ